MSQLVRWFSRLLVKIPHGDGAMSLWEIPILNGLSPSRGSSLRMQQFDRGFLWLEHK